MEAEKVATFQVFKGKDERYYWRLVGSNGEIMAQSEGYDSKGNAKRAARNLISGITFAEEIDMSAANA
jgi:uncharacterized protein YegP (UPF0339 family)